MIRGLTILDKELFLVNYKSSEFEVYDSIKLSLSRQWNLKTLLVPEDIVSCDRNKCLYISDVKGGHQSSEILRVDKNGKLIKKWSTKGGYGQLSVTHESNVILAVCHQNKLSEYSPDGELIGETNLTYYDDYLYPNHAIKLTNGQFVFSHGLKNDGFHRVCLVAADGKLLRSFGGNRGSTIGETNVPGYLSVDANGFVLVADSRNSQVIGFRFDI